jgi:hypothetical protein
MAASPIVPQWFETENVVLASPSVNVAELDDQLVLFLQWLGRAHRALFGIALVITSGNDGEHVLGSAHGKNKAVDIRSIDLLGEGEHLMGCVLSYSCMMFRVAVFDERHTTAPHWHIQTADSVGG